jgi:hypothetical protein
MSPRTTPTADQLKIATAARFVRLPKPLTARAVDAIFKEVLNDTCAKRVAKQVRFGRASGRSHFVISFLCFSTNPPIKFLDGSNLEETRYGFVLLIERRGYLVVFQHLAKGLDRPVTEISQPVDRQRITHIWSAQARYQRFSTRRMTISKQELRGASYEADDLETAFVPALASRSILQTLSLWTRDHGTVGITPSSGRVRVSSSRAALHELLAFVDGALDGLEATGNSAFLSAFPALVDVGNLPNDVKPTGLLFDAAQLRGLLDNPAVTLESKLPGSSPSDLLKTLSAVLEVRANGDDWEATDDLGRVVATIKRLKHSYGVYSDLAKGFVLREDGGDETPLDRWLREQHAYSLSFSSPDYFYAAGALFKTGGFAQEVALVRRFLRATAALGLANSEKGDGYSGTDTRFDQCSIFRAVEDTLASADALLWCGDLGDEWADYVGIGDKTVTSYHCKYGEPTTGASDLQIVTAQALKNLGRIKFRRDEITRKLQLSQSREYWGTTRIPLLARGPGGWPQLTDSVIEAGTDPRTRWCVALVVTSISAATFDTEANRSQIKPHFIQLVWLLSAFVSSCRERDAEPIIYCCQ